MALPLKGIRIIDSALQFPGPYCTMLLADLGAEVIKIEQPGSGDPARKIPYIYESINRNKKSLSLNLKTREAREILYKLVENCDVFTEGFRPGVAKRLGIDYLTLNKINPSLIYCSISGYGQTGPLQDKPGHDLNYLAMAGMLNCFLDQSNNPIEPDIPIGDLSSAMFAAIGILAALMSVKINGEKGSYLDVAMTDGLISWLCTHIGLLSGTGKAGWGRDAGYGIFQTKDNKRFALGIAHEDHFWQRLCSSVDGLEGLAGIKAAQRRKDQKVLADKLQKVFSNLALSEWLEILEKADIPVSPLNSLKEMLNSPHTRSRQMVEEITLKSGDKMLMTNFPLKISTAPITIQKPPPNLGEHNFKILQQAGYTETQITNFKQSGII